MIGVVGETSLMGLHIYRMFEKTCFNLSTLIVFSHQLKPNCVFGVGVQYLLLNSFIAMSKVRVKQQSH
jgi:hypothetical protein